MNITSLTSVFGMGTGVTKLLWLSNILRKLRFLRLTICRTNKLKNKILIIYLSRECRSGQTGQTQDLLA